MSITIASDKELQEIDRLLESVNTDIAVSMAHIKREQGLTFKGLARCFKGLNEPMLKRYMQQSYPSMRPIHIVAAYSWVTMVPMTSFYYGLKVSETFRGMDHDAVEAISYIGNIPTRHFYTILDSLYQPLNDAGKQEIDLLIAQLEKTYGKLSQYHVEDFSPPYPLDITEFAKDYYRSIATTIKQFMKIHNLTAKTTAKVLGLSPYQYKVLENPDMAKSFSISLGIKVKLGFKIDSHVDFTDAMLTFPEFHKLRIAQHIRDVLIVTVLKHLPQNQKKITIEKLKALSQSYCGYLHKMNDIQRLKYS